MISQPRFSYEGIPQDREESDGRHDHPSRAADGNEQDDQDCHPNGLHQQYKGMQAISHFGRLEANLFLGFSPERVQSGLAFTLY